MMHAKGRMSGNGAAAGFVLASALLLPACSATDDGATGSPEKMSKTARSLGPCGDVTYEGACEGSTLQWCQDGTLKAADCAESGRTCGWQDASVGFNCLAQADGAECGDVTYEGQCRNDTLVYCDTTLQVVDCAETGRTCGYEGGAVGYNCLGSSLPGSYDSCEDRFFAANFDANNADAGGLAAMRDQTLVALHEAVDGLRACGANVTLGGMMSLLLYEGALRVAAFNTRCNENSYNNTWSDCDLAPEALYSYQFGIGALHTSNLHPCKGGDYTQMMRDRFLEFAGAAGFSTDPGLATASVASRVHQFCPGAAVNAVDYYLLGAHDVFGIPRNDAGNDLAHYGDFPLFSPGVSISLTFHMLEGQCGSIWSDNDAITIYGGGDWSYSDPGKQWEILRAYQDFAAANCQ